MEAKTNRFEALEVGFELARAVGALIERIERRDGDLARQLRRAGASVPSNLAEGARRRGADRAHFYRIAAGSAAEVRTQVRLAEAWGYVDGAAVRAALALADRVGAMTWRLTHPRR